MSIAAIASEAGLTKQGLLHHFNSKEKIYAAILQRTSDDFQEQQNEAEQASEEPTESIKQFFATLAEPIEPNTRRTRLLMGELLDNNARATNAENWYLKGILERLIGMVKAIEGLQTLSLEEALIFAYQLLGAVNYFMVSPVTLRKIFRKNALNEVNKNFSTSLVTLIEARVNLRALA